MKYDIYYHLDSNVFECNGKSYRSNSSKHILAYLRKPNKGLLYLVKNGVVLGAREARIIAKIIYAGEINAYKFQKYFK